MTPTAHILHIAHAVDMASVMRHRSGCDASVRAEQGLTFTCCHAWHKCCVFMNQASETR